MSGKFNAPHGQDEAKVPAGHDNDRGNDMIIIYVNDAEVSIHRGSQTVAEIKMAGNVPSTDILYLMPDYQEALNDKESITIKGNEHFKSCAPSGCSS